MCQFKSFIEAPTDGVMLLRIADSVSDQHDWSMAYIVLELGKVIKQETICDNLSYALPKMEGWTHDQVSAWLSYDVPDEWPTTYHQGHIIPHITKLLESMLGELIDGPKHLLIPGLQAVRAHLNLMNFFN